MNENFLYSRIIINIYRLQNDFLNEDAITSLMYFIYTYIYNLPKTFQFF